MSTYHGSMSPVVIVDCDSKTLHNLRVGSFEALSCRHWMIWDYECCAPQSPTWSPSSSPWSSCWAAWATSWWCSWWWWTRPWGTTLTSSSSTLLWVQYNIIIIHSKFLSVLIFSICYLMRCDQSGTKYRWISPLSVLVTIIFSSKWIWRPEKPSFLSKEYRKLKYILHIRCFTSKSDNILKTNMILMSQNMPIFWNTLLYFFKMY